MKRVLNRPASSLLQLSPFVDDKGYLRVGGRLNFRPESFEIVHPLILPYDDPYVNHLIKSTHEECGHAGIEFVLSELRRKFWIIKGRQAIKKVLWRCLACRRRYRHPETQQMAPLPSYRLDVAPPFTDTGVDLFGPVSVKSGRYGKKVWVVLFCCLRIRAVFMDVVSDIEAQTFIEVLKRFHSFYPSVRRLHSDQAP